jgi:hypothetical protein
MRWNLSVRLGTMIAAATVGTSCSCDDGTWDTGYTPVCTTNQSSVSLTAPARYDLPTTLTVWAHNDLDSYGPGFTIDSGVHEGSAFVVTANVPSSSAPMSYSLPPSTSPVMAQGLLVSAGAMSATETLYASLHLVSGLIDVAISSREAFRASFAMTFEHPTTGEHFSLVGGIVDISGCHLQAYSYCKGGD